MATQKLEKTEWRLFLDRVSKLMDAKEAEIEIGSLRLGEQVQAKWLPLIGVTYDPGDDLVDQGACPLLDLPILVGHGVCHRGLRFLPESS